MGRGEYQDFPSKTFYLRLPESFVGQPFRVSLISGIENFYASEFMSLYSVEIFRLTVPKMFVGEPFIGSLIPGIEKFYASEGFVTIFCQNFLSHSAAKFRREPFCAVFQKNSVC